MILELTMNQVQRRLMLLIILDPLRNCLGAVIVRKNLQFDFVIILFTQFKLWAHLPHFHQHALQVLLIPLVTMWIVIIFVLTTNIFLQLSQLKLNPFATLKPSKTNDGEPLWVIRLILFKPTTCGNLWHSQLANRHLGASGYKRSNTTLTA